ncbi:MAG: methyltransferase domain-containing protein [Paracoccaceae bacterium]
MHLDVIDLRAFYYRTSLGRSAQRALQEALRGLWPETQGQVVAGFGFAAPFLRPFLHNSARVLNLMPGQQGVMHWPPGETNLSVLIEEYNWPVPAGFIDRLVIGHGLETCGHPDALLNEIWRVLAPGGQVVFIVPNRSGLWARSEATPFGYGRPYSLSQLETQLRKHRFQPERHVSALYGAPSQKRYWLKSARLWEVIGKRLETRMAAGALLVEASKQIYAKPNNGLREAVKKPLEVLEGIKKPKPALNQKNGAG